MVEPTALAYLAPGDHLLMTDSVYGPARVFAQGMLARLGVHTTFFDPGIDAEGVAALHTPAMSAMSSRHAERMGALGLTA